MNKEINLGNLIIPVIKPQKGKDYYTESEKQELISIVTDNVNAGVLPQEQTRQSNEIIRQNNEQTRQAQETIRQTNETNRQTAETERESAENIRQSNESSRVSAEQTRTQTFNNKMDEVDTAIAGIHTSQNAYDQNATAKTSAFNENATSKTSDYNTNATNKTAEYNENASTKIAEYDAHIRDYEAELATKVDKVAGKGLSTNDFTNEEKEKLAELHNYDDTELSERVDDIEQEQAEQNTNISNNATNIETLQAENENLKKIVSQLPQVTGQGTSITLENTIEAPFTIFDVEGNSEQETTVGKQLIGIADGTYTASNNSGSITFKDGVGTISVASGVSSNFGVTIPLIKPIILEANQAYTRVNNSGNAYPYLTLYNEDHSTADSMTASDNGLKVCTPTEEKSIYYIYFWINYNQNNTVIKPMMVEGSYTASTMPEFEKFTYGASPNPNYEQPIKSAGDNENLFDTSLLPITKNGVTISKDSKGNVVLNGTPTITSGYIGFDFTLSSTYLKADTYTISVKNKIDGIGTTINQTTPGGIINLTMSDTAKVKTGKLTADLINGTMGVNVRYDVGTLDNFILNPKLEKSNKATPWSPYGMGSINEKIQTRNLFDGTREVNSTYTNSIKTALQNYKNTGKYATGYINNNNIIASDNRLFTAFTEIQSGEVYTINNTYSATANFSLICFLDKDGNVISKNTEWSSQAYTHTATNEEKYIAVGAFLTSLNYIQIEPGTTSTPYVPHKEQDYPIFVQQPFRSIGDVRDCFVKKSDGWYERHRIFEMILDGTENWNTAPRIDGTTKFFTYSPPSDKRTSKTASQITVGELCNKFIQNNPYTEIGNYFWIYDNGNNSFLRIGFDNQDINTSDQFKIWLSNNNVKVYYPLKTPLDLPCTPEQVVQLENLPSTYKDFTYVVSEDETEAYLEVSGIRDIDTMFDKVTNAIVSLGGNV